MIVRIALSICLFFISASLTKSDKSITSQENKQFIYILRYTPEFKKAISWTSKELEIAKEHVSYIKALADDKKAHLLGRTTNIYDPELFGVVIFDAANVEKATEIMQNDPLISNHIMYGTLAPFSIVFMNKNQAN